MQRLPDYVRQVVDNLREEIWQVVRNYDANDIWDGNISKKDINVIRARVLVLLNKTLKDCIQTNNKYVAKKKVKLKK